MQEVLEISKGDSQLVGRAENISAKGIHISLGEPRVEEVA